MSKSAPTREVGRAECGEKWQVARSLTLAENHGVGGSIPPLGTSFYSHLDEIKNKRSSQNLRAGSLWEDCRVRALAVGEPGVLKMIDQDAAMARLVLSADAALADQSTEGCDFDNLSVSGGA